MILHSFNIVALKTVEEQEMKIVGRMRNAAENTEIITRKKSLPIKNEEDFLYGFVRVMLIKHL